MQLRHFFHIFTLPFSVAYPGDTFISAALRPGMQLRHFFYIFRLPFSLACNCNPCITYSGCHWTSHETATFFLHIHAAIRLGMQLRHFFTYLRCHLTWHAPVTLVSHISAAIWLRMQLRHFFHIFLMPFALACNCDNFFPHI
jgi:hypothetical protein